MSGEETVDSNEEALVPAEDTLAAEAEVVKQVDPVVTIEDVEDDGANSEAVIPDLVTPDDPGDTEPEKEKQSEDEDIIDKLNCELAGKDKIINETELKIKNLEKEIVRMKREHDKSVKLKDSEVEKMKEEFNKAAAKTDEAVEENIKLKKEVELLKKIQNKDVQLKKKYEEFHAREKLSRGSQTIVNLDTAAVTVDTAAESGEVVDTAAEEDEEFTSGEKFVFELDQSTSRTTRSRRSSLTN